LDVMDGHFVPNLTYGPPIVAALRRLTDLPLDVHLMIARPQDYVGAFLEAGADSLTIHAEIEGPLGPVLAQVRAGGAGVGLAINPATPLAAALPWLAACDLLLVMSVQPGFGGQDFDRAALEKLREARRLVPPRVALQVDGGIGDETIGAAVAAGAELLVVGSAIFSHEDYSTRIAALSRLAEHAWRPR
jgi:ribulose-phosphate 3-epimerase